MKRWYILTWPLFFFFLSTLTLLLSYRRMNFLSYLPLYPYLNASIPPHLPNPASPWIISHTLDGLVVIQCLLQMSLLCGLCGTVDAPGTQQRPERACGLASNLSYLACSHEETGSLNPAQHTSQVLTPSTDS